MCPLKCNYLVIGPNSNSIHRLSHQYTPFAMNSPIHWCHNLWQSGLVLQTLNISMYPSRWWSFGICHPYESLHRISPSDIRLRVLHHLCKNNSTCFLLDAWKNDFGSMRTWRNDSTISLFALSVLHNWAFTADECANHYATYYLQWSLEVSNNLIPSPQASGERSLWNISGAWFK